MSLSFARPIVTEPGDALADYRAAGSSACSSRGRSSPERGAAVGIIDVAGSGADAEIACVTEARLTGSLGIDWYVQGPGRWLD